MRKTCLVALLLVVAIAPAMADNLVPSSSLYGWRTWSASSVNSNGTPYWDGNSWDGANKNIGNCLLGNGGCTTQLAPAPGAIPYWGSSTGGADPNFFFNHPSGGPNVASLKVEIAGNANINQFGWFAFDRNSGVVLSSTVLFNGAAGGGASATFSPTLDYGFYFVGSNGQKYYTLSSKNTQDANQQHFAVFDGGSGVYYMGIEDLNFGSSDKDFNDMIIRVSTATDTPEPATMVLLSTGMAGIAAWRKRRKA